MRTAVNRGSEDMAVVGIGELEQFRERLMPVYERVGKSALDQATRAVEQCPIEVGAVLAQIAKDLIEYLGGIAARNPPVRASSSMKSRGTCP